jgi:Mg/Co/Ni transporter MgtE
LNEIRKILENLAPEQAKAQLLLMLKNNQKGDVVSIIKALPPDKQKKLLAEFTSEQDQQQLSEIISELKNTTSIDQTIEKADPGLTGN